MVLNQQLQMERIAKEIITDKMFMPQIDQCVNNFFLISCLRF